MKIFIHYLLDNRKYVVFSIRCIVHFTRRLQTLFLFVQHLMRRLSIWIVSSFFLPLSLFCFCLVPKFRGTLIFIDSNKNFPHLDAFELNNVAASSQILLSSIVHQNTHNTRCYREIIQTYLVVRLEFCYIINTVS